MGKVRLCSLYAHIEYRAFTKRLVAVHASFKMMNFALTLQGNRNKTSEIVNVILFLIWCGCPT